MKKDQVFALLSCALFLTYWAFSFLTMLPRNLLVENAKPQLRIFSSLFFQGWYFFSPPPRANNRLYYVFRKIDAPETDAIKVEIFQDLHRTQFQLFNEKDTILENILNGAYHDVRTIITTRLLFLRNEKAKKEKGSSNVQRRAPLFMDEKKPEIIDASKSKNRGVHVLVAYAKLLAKANSLDPRLYTVQFVGAERSIPSPSRIDKTDGIPEILIFQSTRFSVQ